MSARVQVDPARLAALCRKWRIAEFSLFGSVLRDDFRPDSDVDILLAFEPGASPQLEPWLDLVDELRVLFAREVDVVDRSRLANPYRRHHILANRRVLYAA